MSIDTISEAKDYLAHKMMNDGATCPCCGHYVKAYKRSIHSSMAQGLIVMYKHLSLSGKEVVSLNDLMMAYPECVVFRGGDFAKMRYWDLVYCLENDDKTKSHSGAWGMTELGKAFVLTKTKLPKYAWVYKKKVFKKSGELVSVKDCLGNKFDYRELI